MAQHPPDGRADLAHRILAIFGKIESASRRLFQRQQVERGQVVDMDIRPDIGPGAGMFRDPVFARQRDQPRHLHAVRFQPLAEPVDQRRTQYHRAHPVRGGGQDIPVQRHTRGAIRRRRQRCCLVIHLITRRAARPIAHDAGSAGMQERLVRPRKRGEDCFRCRSMVGAGRIDHRVRRSRLRRQQHGIVERPDHRFDPEAAQRRRARFRPRQSPYRVSGRNETGRH